MADFASLFYAFDKNIFFIVFITINKAVKKVIGEEVMQPQEIMKQLIQELSITASSKNLNDCELTVDKILFEVEIDGVRYYLLRRDSQLAQYPNLSPREQAIANLVARGFSNKSIAKELQISPWTVATYLRRIFEKLNVNSRTAMIARILEKKV